MSSSDYINARKYFTSNCPVIKLVPGPPGPPGPPGARGEAGTKQWNEDANNNLYKTNGYVGIGTDAPNYALDVFGTLNTNNTLLSSGTFIPNKIERVILPQNAITTSSIIISYSALSTAAGGINGITSSTYYFSDVTVGTNFTINLDGVPSTVNRAIQFSITVKYSTNKVFCNQLRVNGSIITNVFEDGMPANMTPYSYMIQEFTVYTLPTDKICFMNVRGFV